MKRIKTLKLPFALLVLLVITLACKQQKTEQDLALNSSITPDVETISMEPQKLSQEFKDYWYAGKAEVSSYELEQARYGEIRKGKAVLIYVTEDFLPKVQVKADYQNPKNVSVLKLNATKKFNTGIYPYSVMQSVFYPVANNQHAIKISSSMQEWCGHVYTQLNNRSQFEINAHSYFEGEADQDFTLNKTILENELWTQLRINPEALPTGDLEIIPSFEYCRLGHIDIKPYRALVELKDGKYTISYPDLNRTLSISFNPEFPYDISNWQETFKSGFGPNAKVLTTKATKLKTIKSSYWSKNQNKHEVLRDTLQLN